MKLETIPQDKFESYRNDLIFDGYMWDMQSKVECTISDKVLIIDGVELAELTDTAIKLYQETMAMERVLKSDLNSVLELGLSREMGEALCNSKIGPNIRYMRFDYHHTKNGWRISEVNSDVPAGYPEASVLSDIVMPYIQKGNKAGCFSEKFTKYFSKIVTPGSKIAYLGDTHEVEDYQIMRFLGDSMEKFGFSSVYESPEHITFENGKAVGIGGIVRRYPVEWLEFTEEVDWRGFVNTITPSCNTPTAVLTQSKRLPLIWDKLGVEVPTWKALLPHTFDVSEMPKFNFNRKYILKPAFGRVGEGINIKGCVSKAEDAAIRKAANAEPIQWVGQEMFESVPIDGYHIWVGVFVLEGEFAGCYARISKSKRIDNMASEIPVVVRGK